MNPSSSERSRQMAKSQDHSHPHAHPRIHKGLTTEANETHQHEHGHPPAEAGNTHPHAPTTASLSHVWSTCMTCTWTWRRRRSSGGTPMGSAAGVHREGRDVCGAADEGTILPGGGDGRRCGRTGRCSSTCAPRSRPTTGRWSTPTTAGHPRAPEVIMKAATGGDVPLSDTTSTRARCSRRARRRSTGDTVAVIFRVVQGGVASRLGGEEPVGGQECSGGL